jgi:thymidylate kinase
MLEGRRRYGDRFFVPAPEKSLLHSLLKRIGKRHFADEQLSALHKWYEAAPEQTETLLRAYWLSDYRQILDCIVNQIVPPLEWLEAWSQNVHLPDAKQTLPVRARQYAKEIRRKARRVTKPTGFLISFLGPDGCGKSTAITGVKKALGPAFEKTVAFHLLPRLIYRGRKDDDTSLPHAKKPRSASGSMAKTLLWFVDISLGYWVKLRPRLVRSTLIIFDRYVHDLQIDQMRYRYAGPQWWARLLGNLSPQPDLWILLDAPAEVLWERKPELTIEESARQRKAYRRLLETKPNATIIDATQPPEIVVAAVCSEVFRRLEARTMQRYRRLLKDSSQ